MIGTDAKTGKVVSSEELFKDSSYIPNLINYCFDEGVIICKEYDEEKNGKLLKNSNGTYNYVVVIMDHEMYKTWFDQEYFIKNAFVCSLTSPKDYIYHLMDMEFSGSIRMVTQEYLDAAKLNSIEELYDVMNCDEDELEEEFESEK